MTMLKRILAVTLSAAMIGAVLTGCSNDKEPGAESKMKLTFLNSKGEIQDGLEAVAKEYKKKTGVDIEILVAPAGTSPSDGSPSCTTPARRLPCPCSTPPTWWTLAGTRRWT